MKIIKNKTNSDIFITNVGMTIAANSDHIISPLEYPMWAYDEEIETKINDGDMTTSDGTTEYTVAAEALAFLRE